MAVSVVGIALVASIAWLCIRGRTRRGNEARTSVDDKAELPGRSEWPELNHENGVSEANGISRPPEADAANTRAELEAWRGHEMPGSHQ